jgi:hypothetical protein
MGIPYYLACMKYASRMGYGMPETDIERKIEKYWGRIDRQLNINDEEEFKQMFQDIEKQFIDPTEDNPVRTVDVVKWLDPTPLLDILKTRYPYFDMIKDRFLPRFRFFAYLTISKKRNLRQAYLSLTESDFLKLGFDNIPNYELLREFLYERLGVEGFPFVFHWIVKEIVFLLKKKDILVGTRTFQDATDVRALKHDSDAKYSGYYKESGYKLDVTIDAELEIPLHYLPMKITADEGKNLVPSQEQLASLGIQEKERIVDDKYAIYENIAQSETNGTKMIYRIAEHWVSNPSGSPKQIKQLYQKYHQNDDFVAGAELEFMLHYLNKKGECEAVGAYYRNQRMKEAKKQPKEYNKKCKVRGSRMEGFFGRVKTTTILDDHPGRRGWKGFLLRGGLSMISLVFAALIRVQNGVLEHLTNVTYII